MLESIKALYTILLWTFFTCFFKFLLNFTLSHSSFIQIFKMEDSKMMEIKNGGVKNGGIQNGGI